MIALQLLAWREVRDADDVPIDTVVVMIGSTVLALILVVMVARSILHPLRRLADGARRVRDGELPAAPAITSGPTDTRVVERTFAEMVATLTAQDAAMVQLAVGDEHAGADVPGTAGERVATIAAQLAELERLLRESRAETLELARTDPLTGLGNRTMALDYLASMATRARTAMPVGSNRGAVVMLDLDGFKSVNDTDGHAEGDRLLGEVGRRLREEFPDHALARVGGDEFVIMVDHVGDIDDLTIFARDLLAVVSKPYTGSGERRYSLSASAGIALVDGLSEPQTTITQADSAVYHAKSRGRGRVEVFDERLARVLEERAEMALTMRHGLAAGEFNLKLQPIIDLATMRPVGAEALLRWQRPGQEEVQPADFIPIAERTGVIVDLDRWVLEQAVSVLRDWRIHPSTASLRLAVNISGRHIVDGSLNELLDQLCKRAVVDPSLLDLEITETHLVADVARAGSVVDDLRGQGVKVAIDDFGTGYSSMNYLHELTVDTLKIDRVFVAGLRNDQLDRSIIELFLRLGSSLGLNVVAEGVEDAETLATLREMACDWAQGFHIARPMPIADATEWLSASSR